VNKHASPPPAAFPERAPVRRGPAILTVLYWSTWAIVGTGCLRFDNLTLFYVWWLVLGTLWVTAARVKPAHTLTPPTQWLALLATAISAALLIHWSYAWFLNLASGLRFGERGFWYGIAFPLQGLLTAILTAVALIPVLTRALGPLSVPILLLAALPAGVAHFGSIFLSLDEWRKYPHVAEINLFDVVILPLIMAAAARRWRTFQLSRRQASNGPLVRLWRGDLSPTPVVWIVYPLTVVIMLLCIATSFHSWLPPAMPGWHRDYVFAIQWLATWLAVWAGSTIVWRTLRRMRPTRPWRASLGQVTISLISGSFLLASMDGIALTVGRTLTESTASLLGHPYQLRVAPAGDELELRGAVAKGLADDLETQLSSHPEIHRIRLDSGGGLLDEAQDAAATIKAHHLDTVVSAECSSACTVLFVAGTRRTLEPQGKLGFHGLRSAQPGADLPWIQSMAYSPYAIDATFLRRVTTVPATSIWYPTRDELKAAHIL
jgi:hypothetical protein